MINVDSGGEMPDIPSPTIMEKKTVYGDTLKEQLNASSRDRMLHFMLFGGTVRGAILHGTKLVNEMRANHGLGILESLTLGHAYMGALLMSSNLKGDDRVAIRIDCDGPISGLDVESNSFGEVRGYLFANPIPITEPPESFDLRPFFQNGTMTVTKILEKANKPYSGQVELYHGNIAQDLAYYSTASEQIPSAFDLSVKFDSAGEVIGAGGLMIQALPGAQNEDLEKMEKQIQAIPSLGEAFGRGQSAEAFLMSEFAEYQPEILEHRRVAFMCHCSRKKFGGFLRQLPLSDLEDLAEKDDEPTLLTCKKCNTEYEYSEMEIQAIYLDAVQRTS